MVIDLVGGAHWSVLLQVLKRGGRYATSGAIAGPLAELDLRTLYLTSAHHNRSAAELQAFPLSGCVISMRVEVPGLPVNFYTD